MGLRLWVMTWTPFKLCILILYTTRRQENRARGGIEEMQGLRRIVSLCEKKIGLFMFSPACRYLHVKPNRHGGVPDFCEIFVRPDIFMREDPLTSRRLN